ncbi:MAG: putative toxin-antitoxin system toxin component, PIN family [Acidobacteriota bacterium]|nr:putative toxin-antitoxin system toxin component, PIN family [Acidobacteriota bacterium]
MREAKIYQIVLDTNVLLSALRSQFGASYFLLSLIDDSRFQINLSVAMVLEYEDVLKRPEMNLNLNHQEIDDVLDFLCCVANLRQIFCLWRPTLRDPKDDFVLELAVESNCDYVITFNIKDFNEAEKFGIKAINPSEFLTVIGEIK